MNQLFVYEAKFSITGKNSYYQGLKSLSRNVMAVNSHVAYLKAADYAERNYPPNNYNVIITIIAPIL